MENTVAWWITWVFGSLPLVVWVLWWWNEVWYVIPIRFHNSKNGLKLPPGHLGFPLVGEMFTFFWYFKILRRPDHFINSKRAKYGDNNVGMYRTHLFGRPSIIAWSPGINKYVYQSDNVFPERWHTNEVVGPNSILSAKGQRHARLKSFVSNAINHPNALKSTASLIHPHIVASLQSWADKGTIVAFDELKKMIFESTGELFLSIKPGPVLDELAQHYEGMVNGFRALPLKVPGTAFYHALKCRRNVTKIFRKELEKRKRNRNENEGGMDLMDGLIRIKDSEGNQLSEEEVLDNIVVIFLGGYETTTVASTWALYFLAKFPHVLQKLREENIAFSKSKKGDFITTDEISKLKYTNKVVEETIRMANVSSFTFRSGDQDVEYQGYMIPRGWNVILWTRYLHNDPQNFDNPLCFDPDRWNRTARPEGYHPFGGGPKMCAGNMLARMKIAILLHHLAVGYRWELINPDAKISYIPYPKPVDGAKLTFTKI